MAASIGSATSRKLIFGRVRSGPYAAAAHVAPSTKRDETSVNETELIDISAEDSGLVRDDAARVIDSMLTTVTNTLSRGEEVTIPGLGCSRPFSARLAPVRTRPTGVVLEISAATAPRCTAGAGLKAAVGANNT